MPRQVNRKDLETGIGQRLSQYRHDLLGAAKAVSEQNPAAAWILW